jgi:hypothetical protein
MCACAAAISTPAAAQQAPATTAAPEGTLQEVIVTGSRIPVPANITATSPITVMTSEDIRVSGYTDTIDMLNSLPQNSINAGNDFGNQSSPLTATGGFATVDLRGIGPQRTLRAARTAALAQASAPAHALARPRIQISARASGQSWNSSMAHRRFFSFSRSLDRNKPVVPCPQ